jgi:hypothetical protein
MSAPAAVMVEKTSYAGWPNCYRMTNGEVELIVTTDVGPRIIRYGFVGGQNMFAEFKAQMGKRGEREWQARGGHRLWMGPEDAKLTYALDNSPVEAQAGTDTLTVTSQIENETGLQKKMVIRLAPTGSAVEVRHTLRNAKGTAREMCAWALTMMAPGGIGFHGFPPRGTHPKDLPPSNVLVMWPYTNLGDPCWKFTEKYLILRSDPNAKTPQKLGSFNAKTWGAYLLGSDLFVKHYTADPDKRYPDMGASFETFTNDVFQELETLGPLVRVEPGQTIEHTENWTLHRNVEIPTLDDSTLDRVLLPLILR